MFGVRQEGQIHPQRRSLTEPSIAKRRVLGNVESVLLEPRLKE
jgi:hypothetical protein